MRFGGAAVSPFIVVLIILFMPLGCGVEKDLDTLDAVLRTLGDARLVEPWVSGGFRYSPCIPLGPADPTLGNIVFEPNCSAPHISRDKRIKLLHILEQSRSQSQDPNSARTALIVEIALRRSQFHLKAALESLEEQAHRSAQVSPAIWSDLSAGKLVLAQRYDDPVQLFEALGDANRAVALDGYSLEGHFNRALALEYLALNKPAQNAWGKYLEIDDSSEWADEARRHLRRLKRKAKAAAESTTKAKLLSEAALRGNTRSAAELARKAPEQALQLVKSELLPLWGCEAKNGGLPSTNIHFLVAKVIAGALKLDGDALLSDELKSIETASSDSFRLDALLRAHCELGKGISLLKERQIQAARPYLITAVEVLQTNKAPFLGWALLHLAICEYQAGSPGLASVLLQKLTAQSSLYRSPALAGRAFWQLGLSEGVRGDLASAVEKLEIAAQEFRRNKDRESLAAVENIMASTYDALGDTVRSWRHRYLALRCLPEGETDRRWVIEKSIVESLIKHNMPELTFVLIDDLVHISCNDPERKAQALLRRSLVLFQVGLRNLAERDYRLAQKSAMAIRDSRLRGRVEVDILVSRADALARESPEEALRLLNEARSFYGRTGQEFLLARVLLAHALTSLAAAREDEAQLDLTEAIARAEGHFRAITNPELKLSFLGEMQAVFDALIQAQYPRDPDAAFATTERARSRILLEKAGTSPMTSREVCRFLQADHVLIEYALLRGRVLIWVLTRHARFTEVIEWTTAGGPEAIRGLTSSIAGTTEQLVVRKYLSQLYDLLIRPVTMYLPAKATVVIVSHGELSSVPFSALLDRVTGRYLIEDYPILVSPSASLYVNVERRSRALRTSSQSLLLVSDPIFDRRWHANLPSLSGARTEVAMIASLYSPQPLILGGSSATPHAVATEMRGRDIVHFAVHAITNSRQPELSALALTPSDREPSTGDLTAEAIEHLPLAKTHLVILASCEGASGPIAAGEGTLSLARSFIAAGVATVVAGLWRIDDRLAATLFIRFHERVREGVDPVAALRGAQLSMLRSAGAEQSPLIWGGFQAFGAGATWKNASRVRPRKKQRNLGSAEYTAPPFSKGECHVVSI